MVNIMIRWIPVFMLSFLVQAVDAQECPELFQQAFRKIKDLSAQSGKGLSMKYSVNVKTADGKAYNDQIEMAVFKGKVKVVSSEFTVYQDEKTMVVIQPDAHTIFMTRPVNGEQRKSQLQDFIMLQDSLFKRMVFKNCIDEKNSHGQSLKRINFEFPASAKVKVGLKSVIYWIDEQNVAVKKIQINYLEGAEQRLKTLEFQFDFMDTQYASLPFEGTAADKVLENRSTLRSTYKGYSLVDKRK